jgi:hypothetical protein
VQAKQSEERGAVRGGGGGVGGEAAGALPHRHALPQGAPPSGAWSPGRPWPRALELDGGHGRGGGGCCHHVR